MLDLDTIFDPDRMPNAPERASNSFTVTELPADWHFAWDERAAIIEFDGGLHRERAEAEALKYILAEMQRGVAQATLLATGGCCGFYDRVS